jgi:hypothetical protein
MVRIGEGEIGVFGKLSQFREGCSMKRLAYAAMVGIAALSPNGAMAQFIPMQPIFAPPASATMLMNQTIANNQFARDLGSGKSTTPSVPSKAVLSFLASPRRRHQNLANFVAKTRTADP